MCEKYTKFQNQLQNTISLKKYVKNVNISETYLAPEIVIKDRL